MSKSNEVNNSHASSSDSDKSHTSETNLNNLSKQKNLSNKTNPTTKNRSFYSRIFPLIGMIIGIMAMFGSMISAVVFYYGSSTVKLIIISLLFYQYLFAKKSHAIRSFLLFFRTTDYFDEYKIIYEEELLKQKSLFVVHPHGICGVSFALLQGYCEMLYENSIGLVSSVLINLPISGILAKWMGASSVKQKNFEKLMSEDKNICFLPGGFEEATITNTNEDRVYLSERKGFIKSALRYGYNLYPIYTFGENKLYLTCNWFEKIRLLINRLKCPSAIFFGLFFFIPFYNVRLITVVGPKLTLPQIAEPTNDDVNMYHKLYVENLKALFNRNKKLYGGSEELIIY